MRQLMISPYVYQMFFFREVLALYISFSHSDQVKLVYPLPVSNIYISCNVSIILQVCTWIHKSSIL